MWFQFPQLNLASTATTGLGQELHVVGINDMWNSSLGLGLEVSIDPLTVDTLDMAVMTRVVV